MQMIKESLSLERLAEAREAMESKRLRPVGPTGAPRRLRRETARAERKAAKKAAKQKVPV